MPRESPRDDLSQATRRRATRSNATQIGVGPLSAAESQQLVESVAGGAAAPDAVVARIWTAARAIRSFWRSFARSVREQGDEAGARRCGDRARHRRGARRQPRDRRQVRTRHRRP